MSFLKPISKLIPYPFSNIYFFVMVLFLGYMLFFDKHNFFTQLELKKTLVQLNDEKKHYLEATNTARFELNELDKNKERVARERFYMKKNDETIFIIPDE